MINRTNKTVIIGIVCAVLMFGFSFALVPLYRVVCKVTGLNGGANVAEITTSSYASAASLDEKITIQFVATNNANLPWEFYPQKNTLIVHPTEQAKMLFFVKNHSDHTMIVQAVPSFTPPLAAKYFHKIECFCFRQQTLGAGESKWMPVVFQVDKTLPADVHIITLAYTLFDVTALPRKSG